MTLFRNLRWIGHLIGLAKLERADARAQCERFGHIWSCLGGCNCGCHDLSDCSVPVHECKRCGACDYGVNEEAREVVRTCTRRWPTEDEER